MHSFAISSLGMVLLAWLAVVSFPSTVPGAAKLEEVTLSADVTISVDSGSLVVEDEDAFHAIPSCEDEGGDVDGDQFCGNVDNCPTVKTGSLTCDQFDLDGSAPVVTALDTIRFKQMLNLPMGPKCAVCGVDFFALPCVGDACP